MIVKIETFSCFSLVITWDGKASDRGFHSVKAGRQLSEKQRIIFGFSVFSFFLF